MLGTSKVHKEKQAQLVFRVQKALKEILAQLAQRDHKGRRA